MVTVTRYSSCLEGDTAYGVSVGNKAYMGLGSTSSGLYPN